MAIPFDDFTERELHLINTAVEKAFLLMPEAVQHLIMQKSMTKKVADDLFKENKGLYAHLDLVQSVIESTEAENPGVSYGKILELATPTIKDKIKRLTEMDYKKVQRPSTALTGEIVTSPDFGAI